MPEQTADRVQRRFAQVGVAVTGKERLAVLPQRQVGVHAAAVVREDRLGHEGDRLVVAAGDVLDDVLVPHELVGHLQQRREPHVDLALPGRAHLMVMRFHDDAHLAHLADHLAAQVLVGVGGADGEVSALVARLVAQVGLLEAGGVPRTLHRVDLVVPPVLVLLVADLVKDEELGLGPDVAEVGDARRPEVLGGLAGDVARIARVVLARHGIDDVGDHADSRRLEEWIDDYRRSVGDGEHVRDVNALPAADRGAIEPKAVDERVLVERLDGERAMLPRAEQIGELQIQHLGILLLGVLKELSGCHRRGSCDFLARVACKRGQLGVSPVLGHFLTSRTARSRAASVCGSVVLRTAAEHLRDAAFSRPGGPAATPRRACGLIL